jgi:hypothetical protein
VTVVGSPGASATSVSTATWLESRVILHMFLGFIDATVVASAKSRAVPYRKVSAQIF